MPAENTAPRIVVGVDGSASSRAALRWAVRQAKLTGGTVDAVIAWQLPTVISSTGWTPVYVVEEGDFAEDARKHIDAVIADVVEPADSQLVHTQVV
jgi:nucleotide-binding universal stress UspA family protein